MGKSAHKSVISWAMILIFLSLVFVSLWFIFSFDSGRRGDYVQKVCLKHGCVWAAVADTPQEREQGLMLRKKMQENQGMLFVFEKIGMYKFWMKNMQFPLDILWIDGSKRIIDIKQNVPPCSDVCQVLIPQSEARFVLELNAGFVEKHYIHIGDTLNF